MVFNTLKGDVVPCYKKNNRKNMFNTDRVHFRVAMRDGLSA